MSWRVYMENEDGVHLMSALNPEYSLCGEAWDVGSEGEPGRSNFVSTDSTAVTCLKCIEEITNCRYARVRIEPAVEEETL